MQHDVKSWYNGLTDKWEKCYSSKKKHFVQRLKNVHVLVKELKKNANILDIGCGTGEITSSLHKRFGCNTIGIDIQNRIGNQDSFWIRLLFSVARFQILAINTADIIAVKNPEKN